MLACTILHVQVMDFDCVTWSLRQADAVVPIGVNRLAWSPCWSCCHNDLFGCLGDFGIAERALPHRAFGAQTIFLLLLTLHKLLIMQQFYYYYYLRFALFFVHRKMIRGLRRHSAGLHWPCYVTTSACRAFRSATSGPAWGMEPCPASSSDRVVNTEHINQLSCLHAQSFKFLTCVRFDQELYFFVKKLLVKIFLVETLFAHTWCATRAHYTWGLL